MTRWKWPRTRKLDPAEIPRLLPANARFDVPDDGGSLSGCRYVQPPIVSFGAASLRGEITLEVGGAVTQDSPLADFLRHRSHSSFRSHGQFPTQSGNPSNRIEYPTADIHGRWVS